MEKIYILINASMPGQVKIGRTNRSADDRARELSASTGIPTPFIVAYEMEVSDSSIAERAIHDALEDANFRTSANREFFYVPVRQAIEMVTSTVEELNLGYADYGGEVARLAYSNQIELLRRATELLYATDSSAADLQHVKAALVSLSEQGEAQADAHLARAAFFGIGEISNEQTAQSIWMRGCNKNRGDSCLIDLWRLYANRLITPETATRAVPSSIPVDPVEARKFFEEAYFSETGLYDSEAIFEYVLWDAEESESNSPLRGSPEVRERLSRVSTEALKSIVADVKKGLGWAAAARLGLTPANPELDIVMAALDRLNAISKFADQIKDDEIRAEIVLALQGYREHDFCHLYESILEDGESIGRDVYNKLHQALHL